MWVAAWLNVSVQEEHVASLAPNCCIYSPMQTHQWPNTFSRYHPPNHDASSTKHNAPFNTFWWQCFTYYSTNVPSAIRRRKINLDSSLKCTAYHFSSDHVTWWVAESKRFILFLELINELTACVLACKSCSANRRDKLCRDKFFIIELKWLETAAAVLNLSAVTIFAMARSSLSDVFLGLPVDFPASHELVSS